MARCVTVGIWPHLIGPCRAVIEILKVRIWGVWSDALLWVSGPIIDCTGAFVE